MITCPTCRATNADGLRACAKCGAGLAGLRGGDRAEEVEEAAARRELDGALRIRRLRRLHAFVGAMTFFILQLVIGLPESLLPLNLALNALLSAVFGLPIGYLISRWRAGPLKGALISGGVLGLLGVVVAGGVGAVVWAAGGLLPGALIGWHVEMDD